MERLQYNILLEEAGIYSKRKITSEEVKRRDGDFIYKDERDKCIYEIIPNDLSPEEISVALSAKQLTKLNHIYNIVSFIAVIVIILFILSFFF